MRPEDHVAQIRALLKDAVPIGQFAVRQQKRRPAPPAPVVFDAVTRDSHLQRIRYLSRAYRLRWLVDQATFDRPGLDSLEDQELIALHRDLDRAVDCLRDGISFDDAGLLRPQARSCTDEPMEDHWLDSAGPAASDPNDVRRGLYAVR